MNSKKTYRSLYSSDPVLLRAYGMSKIHKPNCLLRIIMSTNNPLRSLTEYITLIK